MSEIEVLRAEMLTQRGMVSGMGLSVLGLCVCILGLTGLSISHTLYEADLNHRLKIIEKKMKDLNQ